MTGKLRSMRFFFVAAFFSLIFAQNAFAQRGASSAGVISQNVAGSRGLFRQWENQVEMNARQDRLLFLKLDAGTLFAVTADGRVHAMDAETGATLWKQSLGKPGLLTQEPGVSENYLGLVNGSTLFILNRHTGRVLLDTQLESAPATGPAITKYRAYVPLANGRVHAYDLQPVQDPFKEFGKSDKNLSEKERKARRQIQLESLRLVKSLKPPLALQTLGDVVSQPMVTRQVMNHEYIAWTTDDDVLTLIDMREEGETVINEKYHISIAGGTACSLGNLPFDPKKPSTSGILFAGTKDGFVYGIHETDGEVLWRFPAGEQISSSPIYVDGDVFVATILSGMYCLDALTGGQEHSSEPKWWTPRVQQFLACSKGRVYGVDKGGNLTIMDRRSGQVLSTLPILSHPVRVVNDQTDRLYLATETGAIICLRETMQDKPIYFREELEEKKAVTVTGAEEDKKTSSGGDDGEDDDSPFGTKSSDDGFGGGTDSFGDDGDSGGFGDDSDSSGFGDDDDSSGSGGDDEDGGFGDWD